MDYLQTNLFPSTNQPRRATGRSGRSRHEGLRHFQPMTSISGELPTDQWRYGFELAWNGIRALTYLERKGNLRVQISRTQNALLQFPEFAGLAEVLTGRELVLDGKIATAGPDGRPDPARLRERALLTAHGNLWQAVEEFPMMYVIFDVLHIDGRETTRLPYHHRRELLESLELIGPNWDTPPYLEEEGTALVQACRHRRLNGVVAKRIDSIYESGKRSRAWLKVRIRPRQTFLIGGIVYMANHPALLLGYYDCTPQEAQTRQSPQRFLYAGKMPLNDFLNQDEVKPLMSGLQRKSSPFSDTNRQGHFQAGTSYFEPIVGCEVEFSEWSPHGVLQNPMFKNIAHEIDPRGVIREA